MNRKRFKKFIDNSSYLHIIVVKFEIKLCTFQFLKFYYILICKMQEITFFIFAFKINNKRVKF